jgi:hypothetical protein
MPNRTYGRAITRPGPPAAGIATTLERITDPLGGILCVPEGAGSGPAVGVCSGGKRGRVQGRAEESGPGR